MSLKLITIKIQYLIYKYLLKKSIVNISIVKKTIALFFLQESLRDKCNPFSLDRGMIFRVNKIEKRAVIIDFKRQFTYL